MAQVCFCGKEKVNTGILDCDYEFKDVKGIYFQKKVNESGVINSIPLTAMVTNAVIDDLINHEDTSIRLYPMLNIKNITIEVTAPTPQTYDDGTKSFALNSHPAVSISFIALGVSPKMADQYNKFFQCGNYTAYLVDSQGAIKGLYQDNTLRGIPLEKSSFLATPQYASKSGNTKGDATITIDLSNTYNIQDEAILVEHEADILEKEGLISVSVTKVSNTTTTLVLKYIIDSNVAGGILEQGLVPTFVVNQESTGAVISGVAVVEVSEGTYQLTFATAPTGFIVVSNTLVGRDIAKYRIDLAN